MAARLFLSSGDLIADRRFDFARDLQLKGDLVAAADLLLQATELAPGFRLRLVYARRNSRTAWRARGGDHRRFAKRRYRRPRRPAWRRPAADAARRRAIVGDAAGLCAGAVRSICAEVRSALVDDLGYRGPALLFKAVLAARAAVRKPAFFKRAIDLGCGTGLAATAFAREVDISSASTCRRA